jgi:hypothetical protein
VANSVRQIDDAEACTKCNAPDARRYLVPVNFNGASDWDKTSWNPGLGCITKSNAHAAKIAKERGLIEVGNEDLGKTMASQERKLEQTTNDNFEKAFEPMVYGLKKELLKKG